MELKNGLNGLHIGNGHNDVHSDSHSDSHLRGLQWRVALINDGHKYLTAESFGCKINVSGSHAKKKQIWSLEYDPKEENSLYLKSHLGRYMSGDLKGKATCEAEEGGDFEKFTVSYKPDGSGKWAFKNKKSGYYLGCACQEVKCGEKAADKNEWWTVHVFCHPQISLRNLGRQKFMSLDGEGFRLTTVTPWGVDSIITLEFNQGKYRLRSSDHRYLCRDGSLVEKAGEDGMSSFCLEMKTGAYCGVAFRDITGKYLAGVGKDGVVMAKGATMGRDELFSLEHVHPQVIITASNAKMVSIKQGVDPTANQEEEVTEKEIFQLEFDVDTGLWRALSSDQNYWTVEANNRLQASSCKKSIGGLFELCWSDEGSVFIKSFFNQKFLTSRMNGSLSATSDEALEKELFVVTLVNRREIALRCDHGYLGVKASTGILECNHTSCHLYTIEHNFGKDPHYFLKSANGKYLRVEGSGHVMAGSDEGVAWLVEFRGAYKVVLRSLGGRYLVGEQNGLLLAKTECVEEATLWEI